MQKHQAPHPGIARDYFQRFLKHDLGMMAAAIAYYYLIAIIPALLLIISALGYLLGSPGAVVDLIMEHTSGTGVGDMASQLSSILRKFVENRSLTGLLGIAGFIWVALGLFEAVSTSLTQLEEGHESRSFLRRKLTALGLMFVVIILLSLALVLAWIVDTAPAQTAGIRLIGLLQHPILRNYLSTIVTWIVLVAVFMIAPARRLGGRAAMVGALAGAALAHPARLLFRYYLQTYQSQNPIYSFIGGIVGVIVWQYYAAYILLLAGLLSSVLDGRFRRTGRTIGQAPP